MKKFGFIFFSLFAFVFFIFSCSDMFIIKAEINEIGPYPQPLIERLPIKMGVYYDNDFSTVEITQETAPENIKMGKANIALFDYILSHVFKEITIVQNFPEEIENIANIDLIIEPNIKDYSSYYVIGFIDSEYHVDITYEITFYSPIGKPIASWTIKGKGIVIYSFSSLKTLAKKATNIAMGEVAAKFMTDFCNQVDIKRLFYKECCQ